MDDRARDAVRRAGHGARGGARRVGIGLAVLLAAAAGAAPPARGEGCVDPPSPTGLAPGQPISASLPSSAVHHYVLEVEVPDTVVTVAVDDPDEALAPVLVASCAVTALGGGRHLDGDDWQRDGDAWVVSFDIEEHVGEYLVTLAPDPGTTAFPVAYGVGWVAE